MKLTITGSGSGKPTAGKNLSSLLLEHEEHLMLLDCGEPIARTFAERDMDVNELDAVVISHFHPDHSSGIYMLLQLFHIRKRSRKLKLFLPENVELFTATLPLYYLFRENFPFTLEILDINELNQHYNWLSIIPNDHLNKYKNIIEAADYTNEMKSYSILCQGLLSVLYTSDLASMKPVMPAIEKAEIVIIDALHPSHKHLWKLIESGKRMILTHGLNAELAKKLILDKPENAVIAYDGIEIEI